MPKKPRNPWIQALSEAMIEALQGEAKKLLPKHILISDKLRADINIAFCENCVIDEKQKQDPVNMTLEEIIKVCDNCKLDEFIDCLLLILTGKVK